MALPPIKDFLHGLRIEKHHDIQQIGLFITSLQITFPWSPNYPTIWRYKDNSKTRPSFSAHLYWSFSSTYPWRIPGDKLRELRQNHGGKERSCFVFPEDDDTMIVIVLKSETISKNTVSANLKKFLNHGGSKHVFTKLKEVLDSFWTRVVSLSRGVMQFQLLSVEGVAILKPAYETLCNSKHDYGVSKNRISNPIFLSEWLPKCDKSKKHLCFLLLDPKISRGFPITGPVTHQPPIVFQVTWS